MGLVAVSAGPLSNSSEERQTTAADWALVSRGMQHPAGDNREWRKKSLELQEPFNGAGVRQDCR
jgi:hypothetical protein